MLEVSELIDGKLGQELTSLLREYQDVTAKEKDLATVKSGIVSRIREICDHKATFETMDFVFKMDARKQNDAFDKKALEEKYPSIYEEFVTRKDGVILTMGTIKQKGMRA